MLNMLHRDRKIVFARLLSCATQSHTCDRPALHQLPYLQKWKCPNTAWLDLPLLRTNSNKTLRFCSHHQLQSHNLQSTMTMWQVNDKTPLTQWQCVQKFQKAQRSGGAKSNWQAERWPAQAQDETNNGLGIHEAVGSSPSATSTDKNIRIETHRSNNITVYHYHWLSRVNAVTVTVNVNVNFFCYSLLTSPRPPTNDCYTCYADAMLSSHANSRPPCPLVEGKPRVWFLVNVQHRQDPWTFHPQRKQIRWETILDDCAIRNCRLIF